MEKLILSKKEKIELIENGSITIERLGKFREPKSSIIFGVGTHKLWDKVDRVWVFGDVNGYIKNKTNVGKRLIDYKDNRNQWWECVNDINPFNNPLETIISGRKIKTAFHIASIKINRFETSSNPIYVRPVLKIRLMLGAFYINSSFIQL